MGVDAAFEQFFAQVVGAFEENAVDAHGAATVDVGLLVVDKHAFLGFQPEALQGTQVNVSFGFQQMLLAR